MSENGMPTCEVNQAWHWFMMDISIITPKTKHPKFCEGSLWGVVSTMLKGTVLSFESKHQIMP